MIHRIYMRLLCAMGKAVDVKSQGTYPSNVLSNFWGNAFQYDGVQCKSMEGLLQSLKHEEPEKQREVCQCRGKKARHKGTDRWKVTQTLHWKDMVMDRHGIEYQQFLREVYKAMFMQNENFRSALMLTRGKRLCHTLGKTNSYETILTERELCSILTELRDGYDFKRNCQKICSRSGCPFRKD